jgi:hypothetical protein
MFDIDILLALPAPTAAALQYDAGARDDPYKTR